MVSQLDFRKSVTTLLKAECPNSFYGKAKGEQTAPYIVFNTNSVTYMGYYQLASLEVFVIGTGDDSSAVESLADTIWSKFDHLYHSDSDCIMSLWQNTRNDVSADDQNIRRLLFEVHIY